MISSNLATVPVFAAVMAERTKGVNANPLPKKWMADAVPSRALTRRQPADLIMVPETEEKFLGLIIIS
jgi:hypothetical protein